MVWCWPRGGLFFFGDGFDFGVDFVRLFGKFLDGDFLGFAGA